MKKRMNLGVGAAFALTFGILLTGCSANPEPAPAPTTAVVETAKPSASTPVETPKPSTKPSASTEAEFTAEAKEVAKKQEETPLGIDIKSAIADHGSPEIKAAVKEMNVEKGVHTGLSVYQDLIYTSNFYQKRDVSKDFDLVNVDKFTDRMDVELIADLEADKGQFTGVFTFDSKQSFGYTDKGKQFNHVATQMPSSTFDTPKLSLTENGDIRIDGTQFMTIPTKSETMLVSINYVVEVTSTSDDEFVASRLAWGYGGVEVVGK